MSYEAINRLVELTDALNTMQSAQNMQDSMRGPAQEAGQSAIEQLRRNAPVGRDEPTYFIERPGGKRISISHGRPSIRLFGVTLANAWNDPQVSDEADGTSFSITSNAPHMRFIMDGASAHEIRKRTPGPMSFYSFAEGRPFVSGWYRAFVASHGGTEPSDFVQVTLVSGLEKDIEQQQLVALKASAGPLDKFFARK